MKRKSKELALIAVAGGMLVFELVAVVGAMPVVRRAIVRASHPSVRVIDVSHTRRGLRSTHRSMVITSVGTDRVAEAVQKVLL